MYQFFSSKSLSVQDTCFKIYFPLDDKLFQFLFVFKCLFLPFFLKEHWYSRAVWFSVDNYMACALTNITPSSPGFRRRCEFPLVLLCDSLLAALIIFRLSLVFYSFEIMLVFWCLSCWISLSFLNLWIVSCISLRKLLALIFSTVASPLFSFLLLEDWHGILIVPTLSSVPVNPCRIFCGYLLSVRLCPTSVQRIHWRFVLIASISFYKVLFGPLSNVPDYVL